MVNRSPRCSTASRMSEKFLAASVALTSGTKIRLSDIWRERQPVSIVTARQATRS
jgi:hypothetical protein